MFYFTKQKNPRTLWTLSNQSRFMFPNKKKKKKLQFTTPKREKWNLILRCIYWWIPHNIPNLGTTQVEIGSKMIQYTFCSLFNVRNKFSFLVRDFEWAYREQKEIVRLLVNQWIFFFLSEVHVMVLVLVIETFSLLLNSFDWFRLHVLETN